MFIGNILGKSFNGIVRYQYVGRRDQPADKQAEVLASSGVSTNNAAEMIADFNLGRAVNPKLKLAVWHTVIGFNPADAARLDSAKMRKIAEEYLKKMGLDNTQYVVVRHHDLPHNQHLHIIVNRVDNNGNTIDDGQNFFRSKQAAKELVLEYGLTPSKGQQLMLQHPERMHGAELARYEIRVALQRELRTETQRPRLLGRLQEAGITAREVVDREGRVTGISFEKDGYAFKGSALGHQLSSAGIDQQLAANERKQQVTGAASEAGAVHLPPVSVTLEAGSPVKPFASEKAKETERVEVPAGQAAYSGQTGATDQRGAAELERIKEQTMVAVAAWQREKELIATYERQANQADREDDVARIVELRFETIPAAEKRLATYQAEAESSPLGLELLAKLKKADADKVQNEEQRALGEQPMILTVPAPLVAVPTVQQPVSQHGEAVVAIASPEAILPAESHQAVTAQAAEGALVIPQIRQEPLPQVDTNLPTPEDNRSQEPVLTATFSEQSLKGTVTNPAQIESVQLEETNRQFLAQQMAQRQAEEGVAREALAGMRREQALIAATNKEADLAEKQGDYGKVAELRYGRLDELKQRLADYRLQAEATPVGRALLAEQEKAQAKTEEQSRLSEQEQQKLAKTQAAEQRAAQVAVEGVRRERALLSSTKGEAAQAEQQGNKEKARSLRLDLIPQAERRLADYQLQAEATLPGRTLLAELNAQEKARQLAGEVLGSLAAKRGFISHEEFTQKANAVGYHLPPKVYGQPQQVVELSSGRQFNAPLVSNKQLAEVIAEAALVEKAARTHQKTEMNKLEEARAQYGRSGKEVIRLRIDAAQVESLQKRVGSSLIPDEKPGSDGRVGLTIRYNPHSNVIAAQVSQLVAQTKAAGGEVFERAEEAGKRERSAKGFYSNLPINRERESDLGIA